MVSSKAIKLTTQINQILDIFRGTDLTRIFNIYKNSVNEQKQYLVDNYTQILERNSSLKCIFDTCFAHLSNYFVVSAECLIKSIDTVKTTMLELVSTNEERHVSNVVNCIIELANGYINNMKKYNNLCTEFNKKMVQLMEYPKHFWKLFNDNFVNDYTVGCLNIPDLKIYKRVSHLIEGESFASSYCTERSANWIMENSEGHIIVVRAYLNNFKYNCVNFIAGQRTVL